METSSLCFLLLRVRGHHTLWSIVHVLLRLSRLIAHLRYFCPLRYHLIILALFYQFQQVTLTTDF